jgi:hypothetical protein
VSRASSGGLDPADSRNGLSYPVSAWAMANNSSVNWGRKQTAVATSTPQVIKTGYIWRCTVDFRRKTRDYIGRD